MFHNYAILYKNSDGTNRVATFEDAPQGADASHATWFLEDLNIMKNGFVPGELPDWYPEPVGFGHLENPVVKYDRNNNAPTMGKFVATLDELWPYFELDGVPCTKAHMRKQLKAVANKNLTDASFHSVVDRPVVTIVI